MKSLGALDQIIKLLCSFGVAAFDKFNLDDSYAQQHRRVDIYPIDPRPKVKALSGDSHVLADLYSVASLNKDHPDEGVTRLHPSTVVDGDVQRPSHWSCEHHGA